MRIDARSVWATFSFTLWSIEREGERERETLVSMNITVLSEMEVIWRWLS